MASISTCPFCGYVNHNQYTVQLHIEERHTDCSPFVVQDGPSPESDKGQGYTEGSSRYSREPGNMSMSSDGWTKCTRPGCGEYVLISKIDDHLDLHVATAFAEMENEPLRPPLPSRESPRVMSQKPTVNEPSRRQSRRLEKRRSESPRTGSSILGLFSGISTHSRSTVRRMPPPDDTGRLGKRELGPFANERHMPRDVRNQLLRGAEPTVVQRIGRDGKLIREAYAPNETVGLIRVLADLCALEERNTATYLCHPCVRHVRKLYCDGNFCGYWSIQTVLTYVQHMNSRGPQELPHVIRMQELIEEAWGRGICSYSKVETGGILNSRKWIGTQEALSFFTRIGVEVEALAIGGKEGDGPRAEEDLLDYVEAYFISGMESAQKHGTAHITRLAPIYFQRPGHSMAIVGLERQKDGSRNLLVFDSSFATSDPMKRLLNGRRAHATPETLLRSYRKSDLSLSRWDEFEILIVQTDNDIQVSPGTERS